MSMVGIVGFLIMVLCEAWSMCTLEAVRPDDADRPDDSRFAPTPWYEWVAVAIYLVGAAMFFIAWCRSL